MKWLKVIACKDNKVVNLKWVRSVSWDNDKELIIIYYNSDQEVLQFNDMKDAKEAYDDFLVELDNYSSFLFNFRGEEK